MSRTIVGYEGRTRPVLSWSVMMLVGMMMMMMVLMSGVEGQVVNVALNKPITAVVSAGYAGYEEYYTNSDIYVQPPQRTLYSVEDESVHSAQMMVDEDVTGTWWQSTSRPKLIQELGQDNAYITLDLGQSFDIQSILLTMADSYRPEVIAVYKSLDGVQYDEWMYRTETVGQCIQEYEVPVLVMPSNPYSILCSPFPNDRLIGNETVTFSLVDMNVLDWKTVRFIQFGFYGLDITLGVNGVGFQHFSVANLEVMAECVCNGHNTDCLQNEENGQFQCVCGDNTAGIFCQECLPFYNQQAFSYGAPCEPCNCHNHSDVCMYDPISDQFSLSMNAEGVMSGGGVCIDCDGNTTGVNCERCIDFYYRPEGVLQTSWDACVHCDCNPSGVTLNVETGNVGDCVMNDDLPLPSGMTAPGDCFCKTNVMGAKCDTCKPGFFNLMASNPDGCEACYCNPDGTVDMSFVCGTEDDGQCECKTFVINRQCNECLDGYYGLAANNTEGCSPCDCDVGGATNALCNKETGQCDCRPYIGGRRCDSPADDYYYPDLHFINGQFERLPYDWYDESADFRYLGYDQLLQGESGSASVMVPYSSLVTETYSPILRYGSAFSQTVNITLGYVAAAGQTTWTDALLPACLSGWCYLEVAEPILLYSGETVTFTVDLGTEGPLALDEAILLPQAFIDTTYLWGDAVAADFSVLCDAVELSLADEDYCLPKIFSLTSNFKGEALNCDCHQLGTNPNSTSCETYAGQCECMPGVGGRRCDVCLPGYYSLSIDGCIPCGCEGTYTLCDQLTGQCECPPNVQGLTCNQCSPGYWNLDMVTGCEACGCDPVGSSLLQCNLTTGLCTCKPGVNGDKCEACLPGYKNFGQTGCSYCYCDPAGSQSEICDATTGQCPCKGNTEGLFCERCTQDSFYMSETHPDGCLSCICMGITDDCDSTSLKLESIALPVSVDDVTSLFAVSTLEETITQDLPVTTINGMQMVQTDATGTSAIYWQSLDGLQGDLVELYGNQIWWDVYYTADSLTDSPVQDNQVALIGLNGSVTYYFDVPAVPLLTTVTLNVTISDLTCYRPDGVNITRADFLLALADVEMILLPASYYSAAHTSSLGNVYFDIPTDTGTGAFALSTEECVCGEGYSGLSCQTCEPGYRRENVDTQGYLGNCVGCECYNHADFCDPDSGQCMDCQDNTQGFHCDECIDGYYGDPTTGTVYDCNLCPCYEPRVVNSSCILFDGQAVCLYCAPGFAGTLCDECDDFHYGQPTLVDVGSCQMCMCNNNTEVCDSTTGECLGCQYNTTGFNCERCQDGTFGNASNQDCQPCDCSPDGSTNDICDYESGQCDCKTGVGNRQCDACLPDYFGYNDVTIEGCVECFCNEFGSVTTQCDETGQCDCVDYVEAGEVKCETCVLGYWGLPNQTCTVCGCDATGSINVAEPCDLVTGQCTCKPGVTGRQCDECEFMYTGFSEDGCTACDDCPFILGNATLVIADNYATYWATAQVVGEIQAQDDVLQNLTAMIAYTSAILGGSTNEISTLTDLKDNLTAMAANYVDILATIQKQADEVETACVTLYEDSLAELERQETFANDANFSLVTAANTVDLANYVAETGAQYQVQAAQIVGAVSGSNSNTTLEANYDEEKAMADASLEAIIDTKARAEAQNTEVMRQANLTSDLAMEADVLQVELVTLTSDLQNKTNSLNALLAFANSNLDLFNQTETNRLYAEQLFSDTSGLLDTVQTLLSDGKLDYEAALQMMEDTITIINNTNNVNPLPITVLLDLQGVSSWQEAVAILSDLIVTVGADLVAHEGLITGAETKAAEIQADALAIEQEFSTVQSLGQNAVDAIANYQSVVDNLVTATEYAAEASATIAEVQATLQDLSIPTLTADADESFVQSTELQTEVNLIEQLPDQLSQALIDANISLLNAQAGWSQVTGTLDTLYQLIDGVDQRANGANNVIENYMSSAQTNSDLALSMADTLLSNNVQLNNQLDTIESNIDDLNQAVDAADLLQDTISANVESLETILEDSVGGTIVEIEALQVTTNAMQAPLEDKLAQLEALIDEAYAAMLTLEQPVSFGAEDYETVPLNGGQTSQLYDEIILEFQYALDPEGVLFFVENTATTECLSIQLVEGQIVFQFNNEDEELVIISQAVLTAGSWYRITATRYGIDGQLTVALMETGGVAVSHLRGSTIDNVMELNSPIFVGGLPPDYNSEKVFTSGSFVGCMANVQFEHNPIELWNQVLLPGSDTECCAQPPSVPTPAIEPDSICFGGVGYVAMPTGQISFVEKSHVSFHMRTHVPDGVILLVDENNKSEYYGIFIIGGRIIFEYGQSSIDKTSIGSINSTYNDGVWYQVTVMHNSTYAMLYVKNMENSTVQADLQTTTQAFRVLDELLTGATLTLGGQNPNTFSHGPVMTSFGGCLTNIQASLMGSDWSLMPIDVVGTATSVVDIDFSGCYESVVGGLGFMTRSAYATHDPSSNIISSIEFKFLTSVASGILVYGVGSGYWFYVCLFNGDVFMQLKQPGISQPEPIMTRGLYHADAQIHTVKVEFNIQNSPKLIVDGVMHYGEMMTTTPNMILGNSGLIYLGGVPTTSLLDPDLPVTDSIIGGITSLKLSGNTVNIFSHTLIPTSGAKEVSWCGLPSPPASPPAPPYPTTTPPPTTPAPTCTPPGNFTFLTEAARFGDFSPSFAVYSINSASLFQSSFTITMEFRTVMPDGIILYADDGSMEIGLEPQYYICLFLYNGKIHFSMQTNSISSITNMVTTNMRYDNSTWYEVTVLRINDFIALVITSTRDYKNNAASSMITTFLSIQSPLYIGGVPNYFAGTIFGASNIIPIGTTSFHGCIRKLRIATQATLDVELSLSNPSAAYGVKSCYEDIATGLSFSAAGAFARLINATGPDTVFDVTPNFYFDVTFRMSTLNGVLLAAYTSQNEYFFIDVLNSKVRAIFVNDNPNTDSEPLVVYSPVSVGSLCDNEPHRLQFNFTTKQAAFKIDLSEIAYVDFPSDFTMRLLINVALYVGGHPAMEEIQTPGVTIVQESVDGCISNVYVNQWATNTGYTEGTLAGCPVHFTPEI